MGFLLGVVSVEARKGHDDGRKKPHLVSLRKR
jgi:hypothetical protein